MLDGFGFIYSVDFMITYVCPDVCSTPVKFETKL